MKKKTKEGHSCDHIPNKETYEKKKKKLTFSSQKQNYEQRTCTASCLSSQEKMKQNYERKKTCWSSHRSQG